MKHFFKKVIAMSFLVLMATTVFTGCNGKDDNLSDSNTDSQPKIKMEKIRVWSDNAHEKDLRLKQIENFNNTIGKEKGIEIEYTVHGANYQDTIKIAAQSGEAPELFRPTGAFLTDFVKADYMVPITRLPGGDELTSKYEGSLVNNQHIFNGKIYTLPYNITTYKFIVNDDLFKKAGITKYPSTWEEVRQDARLITELGNGKEYGWILGLQSSWMISSYITRPNATNVGHVGFNHGTMQFEYSDFAPVIEAIKGMIEDGSVFPGFEALDADSVRAQFAEGRIGMIPAASFDAGVYTEQFPAKCNWSVINVPSFKKEGSPYKEFADATSLLGVGTAALEKPEKTLEVLKFFYSDENAAQMYEESLYIPFRQEAIDLAEKEPKQKGFADFAYLPNRVLMLPSPDTRLAVDGDPYRDTIMKIFTNGYESKHIRAVLADLDARYNEAFNELTTEEITSYRQTFAVLNGFRK